MTLALAFAVGFLVTTILILVMMRLAPRIGLVDRAGGHKLHHGSVPVVGGIAMFCAFFFAVLASELPLGQFRALFAGGALLVIVGVLDDFRHLPAWIRFAAQIGAALLMTLWGGVVLEDLGSLLGTDTLLLGELAVPFTVFSVVGVINAVNMMDGLDGLAGGLVAIVIALLAALAAMAGQVGAAAVLVALLAVVAGFLVFNIRRPGQPSAAVFMGDAGSMFLGFTLAWFLVELSQSPADTISPVTALWLLALPLLDTVTLMVRRLARRRSPFRADREHLHHALLARGLSQSTTVAVVLGASALLALAGALAQRAGVPPWIMFSGFAALFAGYFLAMRHLWTNQAP